MSFVFFSPLFFLGGATFVSAGGVQGELIVDTNTWEMRFQQLRSDLFSEAFLFLCNETFENTGSRPTIEQVLAKCRAQPVFPFNVTYPDNFQGQLYWQGNYNFQGSEYSNLTAVFCINLSGNLLGGGQFFFPSRVNASNERSGSVVSDPRTIGVTYDLSQMFLGWSLFLLVICAISMTFIWHTRHYQSITIILITCIIANILVVILQVIILNPKFLFPFFSKGFKQSCGIGKSVLCIGIFSASFCQLYDFVLHSVDVSFLLSHLRSGKISAIYFF
jgi:hypothetical protein